MFFSSSHSSERREHCWIYFFYLLSLSSLESSRLNRLKSEYISKLKSGEVFDVFYRARMLCSFFSGLDYDYYFNNRHFQFIFSFHFPLLRATTLHSNHSVWWSSIVCGQWRLLFHLLSLQSSKEFSKSSSTSWNRGHIENIDEWKKNNSTVWPHYHSHKTPHENFWDSQIEVWARESAIDSFDMPPSIMASVECEHGERYARKMSATFSKTKMQTLRVRARKARRKER